MRRTDRFKDDQAEIVLVTDALIEQLDHLRPEQQIEVVAQILGLCERPGGKHPLRRPLAGWNTLDVLANKYRLVYRARVEGDTGLIEVMCLGPRRGDAVYDMAVALSRSGLLSDDDVISMWDALGLLEIAAEHAGVETWDYRPEPAPKGMQKAAVAAGLVDEATAAMLSKKELEVLMETGWDQAGNPSPTIGLEAALRDAVRHANFRGATDLIEQRSKDRCRKWMPRARAYCIRRKGHPGAHRSTV